ncbi:MAG: hypothetical protein LBT46_11870 [Planctomycetaceae bacterium]|jgi:hypothetical protein|nr:hypothetical protein [Planctomycetaceae bacterium]
MKTKRKKSAVWNALECALAYPRIALFFIGVWTYLMVTLVPLAPQVLCEEIRGWRERRCERIRYSKLTQEQKEQIASDKVRADIEDREYYEAYCFESHKCLLRLEEMRKERYKAVENGYTVSGLCERYLETEYEGECHRRYHCPYPYPCGLPLVPNKSIADLVPYSYPYF